MRVLQQVPLAQLTTLRLGGPARRVVEIESEQELAEVVQDADAQHLPLFVLGGGSNVVAADEGFDGIVVRPLIRRIEVQRCSGAVRVRVGSGEEWDAFVFRCVHENWSGFEALSGIPGLIGATPIQNVGAYGHEVGECLCEVRAFDRCAREFVDLDRDACGLGYRSSRFKREPDRYVISGVVFELRIDPLGAPVRYAELARVLGLHEDERAPLGEVRNAVMQLRRSKAMVVDPDDPDSVSAGSYFVNPVLDADAHARLNQRLRALGQLKEDQSVPGFAGADGRWKVAAAWLIERAGFNKGYQLGNVGISRKHALALVNCGGTTAQLLELEHDIVCSVWDQFGIQLVREPVWVGKTARPL